jgi:hypothetical protein
MRLPPTGRGGERPLPPNLPGEDLRNLAGDGLRGGSMNRTEITEPSIWPPSIAAMASSASDRFSNSTTAVPLGSFIRSSMSRSAALTVPNVLKISCRWSFSTFLDRFATVTLTRGGVRDLLRAAGDLERLPGDLGDLDLLTGDLDLLAGDRDLLAGERDLLAAGDLDFLRTGDLDLLLPRGGELALPSPLPLGLREPREDDRDRDRRLPERDRDREREGDRPGMVMPCESSWSPTKPSAETDGTLDVVGKLVNFDKTDHFIFPDHHQCEIKV